MQVVEYQPVKWLKGKVKAKTLLVSHYVVSGSLTAGKEPELSPELFRAGNQLFLLFAKGPGQFWKEASGWRSGRNPFRELLREQDKNTPHGTKREELDRTFTSEPEPKFNSPSENCGVLPPTKDNREVIEELIRQ